MSNAREMTDVRITTFGDVLAIPAEFDVQTWNVGRSGDLGGGVEVWTSWLPVSGIYETLVILPNDTVVERYYQAFAHDSHITHSREAAADTHRATVQQIMRWLAMEETR